jgi:hypothetical protein
MVCVLDELLRDEIQVIGENHRFVLVGELQNSRVVLSDGRRIVDGHRVETLTLESVDDDRRDVLIGEHSHACWRNFSGSSWRSLARWAAWCFFFCATPASRRDGRSSMRGRGERPRD